MKHYFNELKAFAGLFMIGGLVQSLTFEFIVWILKSCFGVTGVDSFGLTLIFGATFVTLIYSLLLVDRITNHFNK